MITKILILILSVVAIVGIELILMKLFVFYRKKKVMNKEVQQIKNEIERLKEIAEYNLTHCKMDRSAWMQQVSVCVKLLIFIEDMEKTTEQKTKDK